MASDEVVDIFAAAGLKKPDISILSDEFLAEVRGMPQKNLAVENVSCAIHHRPRRTSRPEDGLVAELSGIALNSRLGNVSFPSRVMSFPSRRETSSTRYNSPVRRARRLVG